MIVEKALVDAQELTTGAATYYTVPANTRTTITKAGAVESTDAAVEITVHLVPSGDAVGDDTLVINQKAIGPKESLSLTEMEGHVLEAGDTIQMLSDTNSAVTPRISGIERPSPQ